MPKDVRVGALGKPELLAALREHGIHLNQAATDLFSNRRFKPGRQARVIRIAVLPVSKLGFPTGATYRQLTERASESGLSECPLELGPYLRLQFLDQPEVTAGQPTKGQAPLGSITVVSRPLDNTDDAPKGFYLRQVNGSSWLRGYWSSLDHVWSPDDVLVFSRDDEAAYPVVADGSSFRAGH